VRGQAANPQGPVEVIPGDMHPTARGTDMQRTRTIPTLRAAITIGALVALGGAASPVSAAEPHQERAEAKGYFDIGFDAERLSVASRPRGGS
jgi:hypothetical protein